MSQVFREIRSHLKFMTLPFVETLTSSGKSCLSWVGMFWKVKVDESMFSDAVIFEVVKFSIADNILPRGGCAFELLPMPTAFNHWGTWPQLCDSTSSYSERFSAILDNQRPFDIRAIKSLLSFFLNLFVDMHISENAFFRKPYWWSLRFAECCFKSTQICCSIFDPGWCNDT